MTARVYHLGPPDRTGWFLGLRGAQVVPLGGGIAVAAVMLITTQSLLFACIPLAAGMALGLAPVGSGTLLEAAPIAAGWLLTGRRRTFEAPSPLQSDGPVLPATFGDCDVIDLAADGTQVAVVVNRRDGMAAASLRLTTASPFLLAHGADQERMLAAFGDALTPLCRERNDIVSVRWTSFASPVGRSRAALAGPAAGAYGEVLDAVASVAHHEIPCTLMVNHDGRRLHDRLSETLVDPLLLLGTRLAESGLDPVPLDRDGLGFVLRRRLDPHGRGAAGRLASLAQAAGFAPLRAAGPMSTREALGHIRVDATFHRTYQVVEWPRAGVPAPWMADLLLALPPTRTVCVVFEPLTAKASRRAIGRQAAKLDSDETQRRRSGFRVGAEHEATRVALEERERELVAGYPELDYAALVVLSAADEAELDAREREAQSAAAAAGVELVPLTARHAGMLAVCLPIGRTLPRSRR